MNIPLLVFTIIISLGSVGVGIWALFFSLFKLVWGIKSKTWPDVTGIITESRLKKKSILMMMVINKFIMRQE